MAAQPPRSQDSVPAVPRGVLREIEATVRAFGLFEPGERVAVGISGGKDSALLVCALAELARRPDWGIEVVPVHLDQHQPGFARAAFDAFMARCGVEVEVLSKDTWSVVSAQLRPGELPCSRCSRLRRGHLNEWCRERGIRRLALGHHLDDAIETFFLNLFFGRRLDPLKPATPTESGDVVTVRPLIRVPEKAIVDWVRRNALRPVPCPVCDVAPQSSRRDVGALLETMRAAHPGLAESVRDALYAT
jgi:tRNA 2-thiocytidine biosynthesis protein TtcA